MNVKELLESELSTIKQMQELVYTLKLENEQWYLNWQDELNAISVR